MWWRGGGGEKMCISYSLNQKHDLQCSRTKVTLYTNTKGSE